MPDLLRLVTAGSVDSGKSTLIGRLLYDSRYVFDDQLAAIEAASVRRARGHLDLSLLTDGLRAEREQGITIDVAYRYFATRVRKFVIADTPGHVEYTRNMVTGASTADVCVLVVDVSKGLTEQTRRHVVLAGLLGVETLVVAVNKMDQVDYVDTPFVALRDEFAAFIRPLAFRQVDFIPISALRGDNVVRRSDEMPWYRGHSLLAYLETVLIDTEEAVRTLRLPVQSVIVAEARTPARHYAGRIAAGSVGLGDEVKILPGELQTRVARIAVGGADVERANAGMSVAVSLVDDIDVSRGFMIVAAANGPHVTRSLQANVTSLGTRLIQRGSEFAVKHTTRWSRATITSIDFVIDLNDLGRHEPAESLHVNDIAQVRITTAEPLFVDPYRMNRTTGSFIMVDRATNDTVMAGMVTAEDDSSAS